MGWRSGEKFTERWVRKSTRGLPCFGCRCFARGCVRNWLGTRGGSGAESFGEQLREVTCDLDTAERAGWFVPGADPVDGAGHGEGGELGVAGGDGFVCDSLFDVAADGGVDATLEGSHFFAGLGGKLILVEHGDAAAEVVEDDGLCVGFDVGFDLGEAGAATDEGFVEEGFDESNASAI